jgi:hypothetical protein
MSTKRTLFEKVWDEHIVTASNGRTFSAKHPRCRFPDAAAGTRNENYLVLNL